MVLVIPIDESAPKGRIILPQQQVMRGALEAGALPCATTPEQLEQQISPWIADRAVEDCAKSSYKTMLSRVHQKPQLY